MAPPARRMWGSATRAAIIAAVRLMRSTSSHTRGSIAVSEVSRSNQSTPAALTR